jgi:hypothetical protein
MTETTWFRQRVPSDVILGVEDECVCPKPTCGGGAEFGDVLSDLSAGVTWRLLKEDLVTRQEISKEAMVAVVRRLLA